MKTTLKIIGGVIVLFIVFGLVLDNRYDIERSLTFNASKAQIHAHVGDLKKMASLGPLDGK